MPSSTDERRALMELWFGDPISDAGPMDFLESRGYTLTKDWEWIPPVPSHTINHSEYNCFMFLIEEWDFGGIVK